MPRPEPKDIPSARSQMECLTVFGVAAALYAIFFCGYLSAHVKPLPWDDPLALKFNVGVPVVAVAGLVYVWRRSVAMLFAFAGAQVLLVVPNGLRGFTNSPLFFTFAMAFVALKIARH